MPAQPLARVLDLLAPSSCGACALPGGPVCRACRDALEPLVPPWCGGCGHPVPVAVPRCPGCRGGLVGARQAVGYAGPAPGLVTELKDGRRRSLAGLLAELIVEALPPPPLGVALVPVPLGRRRLATRGFNQGLLLAEALGRRWRRPVADILVRVGDEAPQRGASATERARQVSGAFVARVGVEVPRHVCLIDDVHTTGATLAACARTLCGGGTVSVSARAFARVVPRR